MDDLHCGIYKPMNFYLILRHDHLVYLFNDLHPYPQFLCDNYDLLHLYHLYSHCLQVLYHFFIGYFAKIIIVINLPVACYFHAVITFYLNQNFFIPQKVILLIFMELQSLVCIIITTTALECCFTISFSCQLDCSLKIFKSINK